MNVKRKLSSTQIDLGFNFISLGLTAVIGIIANLLISKHYGPEAFGAFNQVFALYIVSSQLAVFGLHTSLMKYSAEYLHDEESNRHIFVAALLQTALIAGLTATLYFFSAPLVSFLLKSPLTAEGIRLSALGLFFFSLNKVLLAQLVASLRFRINALCMSFRAMALLLTLVVLILRGSGGHRLAVTFSVSELSLFFVLAFFLFRKFRVSSNKALYPWFKAHFKFGFQSLGNGLFVELNSRIDVIILGLFLGDRDVGIYSFAAVLAEGLFQFLVIIRNQYHTQIVRLISQKQYSDLGLLFKRIRKKTLLFFLLLSFVTSSCFPALLHIVNGPEKTFSHSFGVFIILLLGMIVASPIFPFSNIPLQSGQPLKQSLFIMTMTATNIILNFLFVPLLGIYGAALGAGIANASMIYFLPRFIAHGLREAVFSSISLPRQN